MSGQPVAGTIGAPLQGIRVVAIEQYMSGPYCTMLLADAGAEVIKIEQPKGGDPRRAIGPFATDDKGNKSSGGFLAYNRNKKSLTLDLQKPEGREALRRLVRVSDVVVENLRPGVVERLGVGYEELRKENPRLIYAAISGFRRLEGGKGPYWQRPAFDIVVEAMSGIMNIVGFADREPITTIYGLPDIYSGLVASYAISLALLQRATSGVGQFLDISMYDCMVSLNERSVLIHSFTGQVPMRGRERLAGPRGAFKCKDGYVALSCPTDDLWARLARLVGREDLIADPATATGPARAEHDDVIRPIIEAWLADKGKEEATQLLIGAGVPALLYYVCVGMSTHFEAKRYGLGGLPREQLPRAGAVIKNAGFLVLPIGAIVWLLLSGYTPVKAALYAIGLAILVSWMRKATRMGIKDIVEALDAGARTAAVVAVACAAAGITVGMVTLTGAGLKLGTE